MSAKKKTTKKPAKKSPPKNPTDPNLLGRSVREAFLGEPINPNNLRKTKLARTKPTTIFREKKSPVINREGAKSSTTRTGQAKKPHSR